jgi:hypothetical protein
VYNKDMQTSPERIKAIIKTLVEEQNPSDGSESLEKKEQHLQAYLNSNGGEKVLLQEAGVASFMVWQCYQRMIGIKIDQAIQQHMPDEKTHDLRVTGDTNSPEAVPFVEESAVLAQMRVYKNGAQRIYFELPFTQRSSISAKVIVVDNQEVETTYKVPHIDLIPQNDRATFELKIIALPQLSEIKSMTVALEEKFTQKKPVQVPIALDKIKKMQTVPSD